MKRYDSNALYKTIVISAFAIIMFYAHIPMRYFNDDLSFLSGVANVKFLDFFVDRFFFNGKIFTDVLANAFYRMPMMVWKLFDTAVYVLVAVLIVKVFTNDGWVDAIVVCAIIGLFPFWYLSTAGWVATTTNYLYPTLCILIISLVVKNILNGSKISVLQFFFVAVSVLYAANQDQAGIIIIGELFVILIYCVILKFDKTVISRMVLLLSFAAVVYIVEFLLPGHLNRLNNGDEMQHWLPEYADWSLAKKFFRAYTSTVAELMFRQVALYDVFCFVLFFIGICSERVIAIIFSAFPLFVNIGSRLIGLDNFITYPNYAGGMPEIINYGVGLYGMCVVILTALVLVSALITICLCVKNRNNKFVILLSLLLGSGSRLMMGLSATLYASHARTFTYILFALLISNIVLLKEIKLKKPALFYVCLGMIFTSLLHITSPCDLQRNILG